MLNTSKRPKLVEKNVFFFFCSVVLNSQFYDKLNKMELIWINIFFPIINLVVILWGKTDLVLALVLVLAGRVGNKEMVLLLVII